MCCIFAAHFKYKSKYAFFTFLQKKCKKEKSKKIQAKLMKNMFFEIAPKHWWTVLFPENSLFNFFMGKTCKMCETNNTQ